LIDFQSEKLVGAVGLTITKRFSRAELGYWVGKPFWGKGFATEASRAVLKYGFEGLQLNKIYATHMTRNPASGKVMQKIGMDQEGLLKQHALKWDQYLDLAAYGILSTTWRQQHAK
jgi:RimJ/RimL family protein N-acetyltransferase